MTPAPENPEAGRDPSRSNAVGLENERAAYRLRQGFGLGERGIEAVPLAEQVLVEPGHE